MNIVKSSAIKGNTNKYPFLVFSSAVKALPLMGENCTIVKASLDQLKDFIPIIDGRNVDLMPFSTNVYVVNHVNLNGSVIGTKEALETVDLFVNKFVDIEHNRKTVVGTILNVGFSEFETDKPLTREEVVSYTKPFNVVVGGVIWKGVSGNLPELLEESNNPESENYQVVSASYEVAYEDFHIAVLKNGAKNLEDAEIVSDPAEIEKISKHLQVLGGTGKLSNNINIALLLKGEIVPMGIAFTASPAAAVKGVAIHTEDELPDDLEDLMAKQEQKALNKEKISQMEALNVININKNMKILSIKDLTDESLKMVAASSIAELFESELTKSSEQWAKEKAEKETLLNASRAERVGIETKYADLAKQLEIVQASLLKLEEEKATTAKLEQFNQRMAGFDERYELDDADRKVIASQITDLNDEKFFALEKNMEVLLKSKNKETLAKIKEENDKKVQTILFAATATETEINTVVIDAVNNAVVITPIIAATTSAAPLSLKDKYAKSFALNQFTIHTNAQ